MKSKMKRVLAAILVIALCITCLSGIGAYFTGSDVKSDGYTIGQVEVEVLGDDNLYSAEKLTPNYEYEFARRVKNIGINDAYVFMAVTLPTDEVYLHDLDGVHTANQAALTQLFSYGTNGAAGVSSEWAPVTAGKFGNYDISAIDGQLVNKSGEYGAVRVNNTVTYIYAYVGSGNTLARLSADEETSAIFDTMKFANVSDTVADYNIENTAGKIVTQVYAIQADNVLESTLHEGRNDDGSDAINAVWAVLNNATNDKALSDTDAGAKKITVISKDAQGNDLNASATVIEGAEADELLEALDNQGLANKEDVDLLVDVKADDFEGMADTTIDVSSVAKEGDTVIIMHYDETEEVWEYIATDTVEDGVVSGDFSSYSPVAIIVVPSTTLLTVSVVNADGTPFNSSYTNLTMHDYGFANKTTLTQVAPGSNQYVGTANAGTYRIIALAPTITGGDLIEELVITEGQTEATMVLKNTYELVNVTLNIYDMSADAAETTEYEFYLFNSHKLTVAKGEQPVVRLLADSGIHITEANHKVQNEYKDTIVDGMSMGVILVDSNDVVFNITGAPDEIWDIEYMADGVGSGYANFVDGNWCASDLTAGQYFVKVYGEDGSQYVGSFDYDGSASEVSFEVKQYAAQLNIVNADGQSYRIRFLGEVDPFVDTADNALVNLMESGSFTVNEILLNETNYNFTLEYVSGDGSVDGNRITVNSGLVIVNITLEQNAIARHKMADEWFSGISQEYLVFTNTSVPAEATDITDVSEAQDGSIIKYVVDNICYVTTPDGGVIVAPDNLTNKFMNQHTCREIHFHNFDTSEVTEANHMFSFSVITIYADVDTWNPEVFNETAFDTDEYSDGIQSGVTIKPLSECVGCGTPAGCVHGETTYSPASATTHNVICSSCSEVVASGVACEFGADGYCFYCRNANPNA